MLVLLLDGTDLLVLLIFLLGCTYLLIMTTFLLDGGYLADVHDLHTSELGTLRLAYAPVTIN